MNPTRLFPAIIVGSLCACSGVPSMPSLSSMAAQMAMGPSPDADPFGSQPDNNIALPDSYRFSYRVTMRITTDRGTVEPVFYVHPDATYYARTQSTGGLTAFLVYDPENELAVLFAELDGERRRIHDRMNLKTRAALLGAYRDAPDREVQSIGTRTMLGYPTQGYQISTLAGTTQLWVTDQTPATLYGAMMEGRAGETGDGPLTESTMIMEASFTSAYKPEKDYHMEVTEIQPETVVLSTRDYAGEW